MNNYDTDALANHLAHSQSIGGMGPSIQDLPKFLNTAAGKHAVRGTIDSIIARQKVMGVTPENTHQEIIKSLLSQLPGASNVSAPSASSPMQSMQSLNSPVATQGTTPQAPSMAQQPDMQSMLGQAGGY